MSIIEKLGITPGPWNTDLTDFHDLCIYHRKGEWLANLDDKKEDALVMAAAPDMLEALIKVRSCGKDERMSNEYLDIVIEKAAGKSWEEIKELK